MKKEKVITVMTYEQWEEQFKKNLRRYYKRKLKDIVDGIIMAALLLMFFGGMVAYWIIFGY